MGLRSVPAPASARPAVSAAKIEVAARQTATVRLGSAAPEINLLMVTTGDFAGSTPTKPRLDWVVIFPDSVAADFGGPAGRSAPPSPTVPQQCSYMMLFDAMTGADLGSYQSCGS